MHSLAFLLVFVQFFYVLCKGTCSRVIVAGATGYIGRAVVSQLIRRGIPAVALVRSEPTGLTVKFLEGAEVVHCNVMDPTETESVFLEYNPSATICCLASRSGLGRDSWAVDYGASMNVLRASQLSNKISTNTTNKPTQFVLLSAFCCGKPELQFQFAKLKFEEAIRAATDITHSIVRPTAYFKSLDGQLESVKKGNPVMFFGPGVCSANAICEKDLANYLIDCALDASEHDMVNQTRDIGGPDVPPITKLEQGHMIYDALGVPREKRKFMSLPLGIFTVLLSFFTALESAAKTLRIERLQQTFEDAAEITRIVRYYAVEPMVAIGPGEVQGKTKLIDHFMKISERGGTLEEIDRYTTSAGVLDLISKNEYAK